jgi:hypothetical protein
MNTSARTFTSPATLLRIPALHGGPIALESGAVGECEEPCGVCWYQ